MSTPLGLQNGIGRNEARAGGAHEHWRRTAEARRRQAEAIATGVHRVWRRARRIMERLMHRKSRAGAAAPDGRKPLTTVAAPRYSLSFAIADAISRGVLRLAGLVHRSIFVPYARRRRRRLAIAHLRRLDDRPLADIGLTRAQIERAVDARLAPRGGVRVRPVGRGQPVEERRDELPLAA